MSKIIPYGRQLIEDDDVEAVVRQLRGDWLTQGPAVAELEKALCDITGARFAVAVANGTAALHIACLAAGVGPGDSALVPDITFVATANAVRYTGGTPVLVDVDPTTALVSLEALELRVRERSPKAILPVSFAGTPAPLPDICALAQKHGAVVIEDAAHSLGATYAHGGSTFRSASCAHSDLATLSFHPVKHITTGEGGAVTTNDPILHERLRDLRTHGITKDPRRLSENDGPWYYEQQTLGYNYRITDIQCALGASQARKLDRFLERRRAIAKRYDAAFTDGGVIPLRVPEARASAYHLYVVRLQGESILARRKAFFNGLRERGIAPQVHYIPLHRQPDYQKAKLVDRTFHGAEEYYAGCLSLPMFPGLTDDEVERVIGAVQEVTR